MTLSKKISAVILVVVTLLSVLAFASCRNKTEEKVDIKTSLSVDGSFVGNRTMVMTFPQSVIKTGSEAETNLEKVVQKYCPNALTPSKGYSEGNIQYSFELSFESKQEYMEKASRIIGQQALVSFSHPNTIMTRGWKLEENFTSENLLTDWISQGAKSENFSGLDFAVQEDKASVSLNDDTQSSEPLISVNCLDGYPLQRIRIETVKKKGSYDDSKIYYDRTIIFTIAQSTFDSDSENIRKYFTENTPPAASAEWPISNNSYNYTVKFKNLDQSQMRSYTQKLLHTEYGEVEYMDRSLGSTILAEQNSYNEEVDFSNYIGNNSTNVPVEYIYSVSGNTELSECQLYENGTWKIADSFLEENQYGKKSAFKYDGSYMKLRINDGQQYKATSIEIETEPLEADNLRKTVTLRYDRGAGGDEASDYARSYMEHLGYGAVQSVINDECMCTYTTSGTPEALNETFTKIFSGKNSTKYSSEGQFMTLRTMKHYKDHLDLASVVIGKNSETPVIYKIATQSGDILKSFSYSSETASDKSDLAKNEDGTVSMQLNGTELEIEFNVTSPNMSDIIFFSIISGIFVLIAVILILILRNKPLPAAALGGGSTGQGLPGSKSGLAAVKKQNGTIKKK